MSNARNLADIVTGNFDVPLGALDNVPASNDASALTTGTLPLARIGTGTAAGLSIGGNAATATNVAYSGLTGAVPTWNQNTSGNAATATSATTAGNGGVTSVNGATGAVTLSTGGVTSLNGETGAITNTSLGAIGSIIIAAPIYNLYAARTETATIAGSSLRVQQGSNNGYANVNPSYNAFSSAYVSYYQPGVNLGLSGTWRNCGRQTTFYQPVDGAAGATSGGSIWVRIS